ncbi:MAG: acyltransferase 3 [Hyphomicrobiales bacterium]|nr:acyltransferase 3 [Hyphomicrobiales bacterium]
MQLQTCAPACDPAASRPASLAAAPAAAGVRPMLMELESIRGLAALLVVLHHLPGWNAQLWGLPIVRNSYLMVDVFFVLSGFVMHRAYGGRIDSLAALARFQALRFGRLYPVHAAFLLAWACVELAKRFAAARLGLEGPGPLAGSGNTWTAFAQHALLLQAIGPTGAELTFNAAAWSISTEFYVYLAFAALALTARRAAPAAHAAILCASVALLATGAGADYALLLRCMAGFFLGCLVAAGLERAPLAAPGWGLPAAFAAMLAFLHFKGGTAYDPLMLPLAAALLVCAVSCGPGWTRGALNGRALAWLGSISYSLYMSHTLVVWGVTQALRLGLRRPEAALEGVFAPQLSLPEAALANAFILALALAFAAIVFHALEKPSRDISRALLAQGRHLPGGANTDTLRAT